MDKDELLHLEKLKTRVDSSLENWVRDTMGDQPVFKPTRDRHVSVLKEEHQPNLVEMARPTSVFEDECQPEFGSPICSNLGPNQTRVRKNKR